MLASACSTAEQFRPPHLTNEQITWTKFPDTQELCADSLPDKHEPHTSMTHNAGLVSAHQPQGRLDPWQPGVTPLGLIHRPATWAHAPSCVQSLRPATWAHTPSCVQSLRPATWAHALSYIQSVSSLLKHSHRCTHIYTRPRAVCTSCRSWYSSARRSGQSESR